MIWNDDGIVMIFGDNSFHLDDLTIGLLLACLGVLLVSGLLFGRFLVPRERRGCRLRRLPVDNRPPFTKWRCRTCGVDAYSTDRRPPKECKKDFRAIA